MKRLLREPLLHFLALGAVIFALNAWLEKPRSTETAAQRINVTAAVIEQLRTGYERQFGQAPDEKELRGLVTAHIREEVYYREALALGLDRDDTIVRRRMAQKMEFLTGDLAGAVEPSEAVVLDFFHKNAARYARPARVSFRHVYFSKEKRAAKNEATARAALADLATGTSDETMGDAFLHGFEFGDQDLQQVTALFGEEFSSQLAALREGQWSGPIASSYGLHLVRIDARGALQPATLDAVRATVLRDLNEERRAAGNRDIFEKLRERYRIEIDEAALATAALTSAAEAATAVVRQ